MKTQDIKKKYDKQKKLLAKYNHHYFNLDSPIISDAKYDQIKIELIKLENNYSFLKKKFYSRSSRCTYNKKIQKN